VDRLVDKSVYNPEHRWRTRLKAVNPAVDNGGNWPPNPGLACGNVIRRVVEENFLAAVFRRPWTTVACHHG